MHTTPGVHAFPHIPQLFGSLRRSTHAPLQREEQEPASAESPLEPADAGAPALPTS